MTLNKLASEIARREGLKVEIGIGQIREVLRILVEMEIESGFGESGYANAPTGAIHEAALKRADIGERRSKRHKRKAAP